MKQLLSQTLRPLLAGLLLFAACSDDNGGGIPAPAERKEVTVIYSTSGVGDDGYNSAILRGVVQAYKDLGFRLDQHMPANLDEATRISATWVADSAQAPTQRLLVLASSEYEPLLDKLAAGPLPSADDVMLLESRRTDLPAYTLYLPLYGASYEAGYISGLLPYGNLSAIVCANPTDSTLTDGCRGFADGYYRRFGQAPPVHYLDQTTNGYAMSDSLYRLCHTFDAEYSFVYPLVGGSLGGLLRFTREYPHTFYTCGLDTDCSQLSSRVAFSVVKHIDRAVNSFLTQWVSDVPQPRHQRMGLGSGMVEVVLAPGYDEFLGKELTTITSEALRKEELYEATR